MSTRFLRPKADAFTTDPARVEDAHADQDAPLLMVIDEAQSVDPDIIQASTAADTTACSLGVSSSRSN